MEKRLTVEGMKCPHCEAHVKEALEKIPGVTQAVADHTQNLVTVTMSQDVAEDVLKESVTQAGYIFKGIQA
ncbi:MAG: cation transporter [Desulfovibrionaceae bacterium]|nr:cation transporter [Desulfovibrionaceae bacterium]